MKHQHVMIDIETLGKAPDGVILSIGAVKFDNKSISDEFYYNISINSCAEFGRTIDPDTVAWWFQQSDSARLAVLNNPAPAHLKLVLQELRLWLAKSTSPMIWANGASFDLGIIRHAYESIKEECPWRYPNEMCMRSIRYLGGSVLNLNYTDYKKRCTGTLHNALEDAKLQAQYVIDVCSIAGLRKEST